MENGDICLLDSLGSIENHTVNTPSVEIQLSKIYGNNTGSLPIKILEFCINGNSFKNKTNFIESNMRKHLVFCLEKGQFTQFLQHDHISPTEHAKNKNITIDRSCSCGFPDWIDQMKECEWRIHWV